MGILGFLSVWKKRKSPEFRVVMDAFAVPHIIGEVTGEPSFVRVSHHARHPNNSTKEHYWNHPHGHPYEVFSGPHGGDRMPTGKPWADWESVWTDLPILEGYDLLVDEYSDRLYHVWKK